MHRDTSSSLPYELLLHGGESVDHNGLVHCYGDLFRLELPSAHWIKLSCAASSPPHRSGHQIVCFDTAKHDSDTQPSLPKRRCYMFGGEFCTPREERFYHHKDFYRFDADAASTDTAWTKLALNGKHGSPTPSPRSGHRMCVCPHSNHIALLFGGYYDTLKAKEGMKRFNDLYMLDMLDETWLLLARIRDDTVGPSPRSAVSLVFGSDSYLYLFGGYTRSGQPPVRAADQPPEPEEGGALSDAWRIRVSGSDVEECTSTGRQLCTYWERVPQGGIKPSARSGVAMVSFKNKAVLFGGSFDRETKGGEEIVSEFLSDLYAIDLQRHKWQPMRPLGGEGLKLQYVKPISEMNMSERAATSIQSAWRGYKARKIYKLMRAGGKVSEMTFSRAERSKGEVETLQFPVGRMKAAAHVAGSALVVFGGIVEVNDEEYALDDCWMLDLLKMDRWKNIQPLSVKLPKDDSNMYGSDDSEDSIVED